MNQYHIFQDITVQMQYELQNNTVTVPAHAARETDACRVLGESSKR